MTVFSRPPAFPLPMLDFPPPPLSTSRRVRARWNRSYHAVALANMSIQSLNCLSTGAPPHLPMQATVQSTLQDRLVSNIFSASQRFVSRLPSSTDMAGDPLLIYEPDMNVAFEHMLDPPPHFDY